MPEHDEAMALATASIQDTLRVHTSKLDDIAFAFSGVITGQGRIVELLVRIDRQLIALNKAVAQEQDGENIADLLRTMVVQLGATTAELRRAIQTMGEMPADVANVLHADGIIADLS